MNDLPHIPVSWGELLDKIAILEIKRDRIVGASAQANILREHALLHAIAGAVMERNDIAEPLAQLRDVNAALWDIEDAIRREEADGRFGTEFVALARAVYLRNDERAAVKRAINFRLGSALIEEKSYAGLARAQAAE